MYCRTFDECIAHKAPFSDEGTAVHLTQYFLLNVWILHTFLSHYLLPHTKNNDNNARNEMHLPTTA